ncbi:MAG TPA: 3-phosphoserine/phosphohydroxythreonine transaminase [Lentisphaeria bacterium]|nr:3-phosphoserine/phosphohydroxythreonine transaminase [Lentisphaeria bacterium]
MSQVYNFSAGPATLPAAVMQKAAEEFTDYQGLGYGILEASHRSKEFTAVIDGAESAIRELLSIPEDYSVLFLQGGASTQFAMIPMNLLGEGQTADYVDTGSWSQKAAKEGKLQGKANVVASSGPNYTSIPDADSWNCTPDAAYLHITSNNTIYGTQFASFPTAPAGVPLIADMSSDILSRDFDVSNFGLIYGGAQKNLGPSGVTLVIARTDLISRGPANVPTMLRYDTHVDKASLYNTPPTFAIYMVGLVAQWVQSRGGLAGIEATNAEKAALIYDCIDADDFYQGPAAKADRSKMNVCFTIGDAEREGTFVKQASAIGLVGLKGHRSVGGMRASIYNAMPIEGVRNLVAFMQEFRAQHG